ncbi:MAG: dihydrolipoyl dehydrogenase [Myxococcales bacterium]|nr:dihydrolipoyl dehydrogenase [Myxococcales bacterium]
MSDSKYDLVVIGSGPGGYVAAIRAAQLGLKVACIEKEPKLGGTCLRVGCIPSKALLQSSEKYHDAKESFAQHGIVGDLSFDLEKMMARKDKVVSGLTDGVAHLFRKNNVTRYSGHGRILNTTSVVVEKGRRQQVLETKDILIATGSKVAQLRGVEFDGDRIGDSTTALSYPDVPKHLVIIGAGVIGLELGSVWARLGARVTVLEYQDRILAGMDEELASSAMTVFKKQGLNFKLGVKVTGARVTKNKCTVEIEGAKPVTCDRVLVAVGRVPNTDNLGLETVGIELDQRGRVPVDASFQTKAPHVFAIGDVIAGPMLAHKAEEEGIACVEQIVTGHGHLNYDAVPGIVYTHPEIASVGKTEDELKDAGIQYKKGKFPFMANGRARAMGETDGFVKVLAEVGTDRILGAHIIGPNAGDLIAEIALAIEFGASSEDVARSCHAHPTLAEVVKEAALSVAGRAIHI